MRPVGFGEFLEGLSNNKKDAVAHYDSVGMWQHYGFGRGHGYLLERPVVAKIEWLVRG